MSGSDAGKNTQRQTAMLVALEVTLMLLFSRLFVPPKPPYKPGSLRPPVRNGVTSATETAYFVTHNAVDALTYHHHHHQIITGLSARDHTSAVNHTCSHGSHTVPCTLPAVPPSGNGHDEGVGAEGDAPRRGFRLSNGVHLGQ